MTERSGRTSSFVALFLCLILTPRVAPATPESHAMASAPGMGAEAPNHIGIWKTIKLGTIHSVIQLREALESAGCGRAFVTVSKQSNQPSCHLGDDANEALGQPAFRLSADIRTMNLVRVNVGTLGFSATSMPSISAIYQKAKRAGLSVCPAEAGPQLRLQYLDQPLGEFLAIAMAPISNYAREPILFLVGNGGAGLLLASRTGAPETKMSTVVELVFCRPK